ncbi:hypothetical protein A1Q1_00363 [Trichosporon asahii var. asahii CBS 2479]|uniref:Ubiquitin-like domain-containing protein n=1 Tax=Trichosporon asahii var. asahii (strain ATCC 90039 / CBS 2479 / JCM 2466 / KCTC 7840 / NBRC 103889/ NCYC 2677 / UAMH 7654) TaxID=1186058 RepID=J4UG31_TRIAS|nr:hypothetical protein A1Q1_00363 [Trichosporon asahii var. asahii CBS 2479]EJT50385.1 hypothetical protein A1Q1_00363 [Trichosporon asahii var. asahii CBS 2479]
MQPEASAPDPSAVGASSPPLTPFRHPQPLTAADGEDRLRLRRKLSPSMISLHIKTPYAELGASTPISWEVPTTMSVGAAKDALADGSAGFGAWERDGMRLICRGRMLEDFEILGRALPKGETPTLHLVARPQKNAAPSPPASVPAVSDAPTRTASPPAPQPSATAAALADTVHYLLFAAREHLCALLGQQNIAWDDMHPAPTVERRVAREAVASVLRSMAPGSGWEAVLEGDDGDLRAVWTGLGEKGVRSEIESLWKTATGRPYAAEGDSTPVEFDEKTVTLNLPSSGMVPSQLTHLLLYLRLTVLLPHLTDSLQAAQSPSTTTALPSYSQRVNQSPPAAPGGSLTPTLTGPSSGAPSGSGNQRAERALEQREGRRRRRDRDDVVVREYGADGEIQPEREREPRRERERERERRRGGAGARRQAPAPPRESDWVRLPLYHLDVDNRQLRLPPSALEIPQGANGMPGPTPVPDLRRAPATQPGWFKTHILLPLYLWFLTLIPDFEVRRARAIRQRERAIRALVNERRGQSANVPEGQSAETQSQWLPDGISPTAKRYYERVIARPESIDWDEEREAQRAMDLPDEEEQEERFAML